MEKEKERFKRLKSRLMSSLKKWKKIKHIRSFIEDILRTAKSMGLKELHR